MTEFENTSLIEYQGNDILEVRSKDQKNNTELFLSKLFYNYKPSKDMVLRNELLLEKNLLDSKENYISDIFRNTFSRFLTTDLYKLNFKSTFDKKINEDKVIKLESNIGFNNQDNDGEFSSFENIFSPEVPIVMDDSYLVEQKEQSKVFNIDIFGKYYWILNRKNHIYVSLQNKFKNSSFVSSESQNLTSGEVSPLSDFTNNINSLYNYSNFQITYKRILGKFIAEGIFGFENHYLRNKQIGTFDVFSNFRILPQLRLTCDLSKTEEFQFEYIPNYRYVGISNYAIGRSIRSFYSIFTGNRNLDIVNGQTFRVSYSNRKIYGISFYGYLSYLRNSDIVANSYSLLNIYNSLSVAQLDESTNSYNLSLKLSYNRPYWDFKYGLRLVRSIQKGLLNDQLLAQEINSISNDLDIKTKFESYPNLEINANYTLGFNKNGDLQNKQNRLNIEANADYDLNNWKFNLSYSLTDITNKSNSKTETFFDRLNTSIFYNKLNSLWSFELSIYNLTNNQNSLLTNFDSVSFTQQSINVFPRHLMLSAIYKF